jgi:hypothetical protein
MPMLMPEKVRKTNMFRSLLLALALLTFPFACLGMNALGSPFLDIGFFSAEISVENQTPETLYLTPITTTYGDPRVITQNRSLLHKDLPLHPGESMLLTYDSADSPLTGIALCREGGDCRLLENTGQDVLTVNQIDKLPILDESWLALLQSAPEYNFHFLLYAGFALTPLVLLFFRWRLGKQLEKIYS